MQFHNKTTFLSSSVSDEELEDFKALLYLPIAPEVEDPEENPFGPPPDAAGQTSAAEDGTVHTGSGDKKRQPSSDGAPPKKKARTTTIELQGVPSDGKSYASHTDVQHIGLCPFFLLIFFLSLSFLLSSFLSAFLSFFILSMLSFIPALCVYVRLSPEMHPLLGVKGDGKSKKKTAGRPKGSKGKEKDSPFRPKLYKGDRGYPLDGAGMGVGMKGRAEAGLAAAGKDPDHYQPPAPYPPPLPQRSFTR